jgi:hypothetical protein
MRVFSSWQFAGSTSLLTIAVLLCLVPFLLSWPANGSEQEANGLPIDGQYAAILAEEDQVSDQLPKNAMLLRTLVLALFIGPFSLHNSSASATSCRYPIGSLPAVGWRSVVLHPSSCLFHAHG